MKKPIRTVSLIAALALAAAGCQREEVLMSPTDIIAQASSSVTYSVSGETGTINLLDDEAWDLFLNRMMALAREGYQISLIHGTTTSHASTKEVVVYNTDDEDDAKRWAKRMFDKGYDVDIIFDDETGTWTCIATKP